MGLLNRRDFLSRTAAAVGASFVVGTTTGSEAAEPPATRPVGRSILRANDQILLGKTGIKASRLSIGTGTKGGSEQRGAGAPAMIKMLRNALDEGIRWWDAADSYKSHPYVGQALKEVKRDQVTITTKTTGKTAERVLADIERFRTELGTDYLDIVLLHCMVDADWPRKLRGAMDALSEAKEKGWVRAVGCSCHTFEALKAAADEPWGEVNLARINPFATLMDVDKPADVPKVEEVLKTMHERGKAVYGMKILGEGRIKGDQIDESLAFVLKKPYISGFTIGFSDPRQIDDIARRIERIRATA
ncbi:MAG TPA: aldo/keto reductase [Phycisphaerae bacterium]|jgi:aryl-alcohol dehydrogenase-like predicted oxidoreductase|nr:aldo/keto reductase [Phycisphaerae bacterium]HOB75457.1 aldo/keto reductase [Phycisphaerae bacterium]HOJ55319.1 aldo/keto reductase [Phycisphaerae bacterium]HOL27393.1 aldo/keto reductase [Phycisphaerae bacterium]HPP21622.1 aldo/keto reductase [Phycisphaerae bacterium]